MGPCQASPHPRKDLLGHKPSTVVDRECSHDAEHRVTEAVDIQDVAVLGAWLQVAENGRRGWVTWGTLPQGIRSGRSSPKHEQGPQRLENRVWQLPNTDAEKGEAAEACDALGGILRGCGGVQRANVQEGQTLSGLARTISREAELLLVLRPGIVRAG